jgi:hypothetical protein
VLPVEALNSGSTAPVVRSSLARRLRGTPLTVVKSPPMKSDVPSDAIAVTAPLVSATNGSRSPEARSTAMRFALGAVTLCFTALAKVPPT